NPVEPGPGLVGDEELELGAAERRNEGSDPEEKNENSVVEREDPERPPHVEVAEEALAPLRLDEDPRDQESREDEEQVDAEHAVAGHGLDRALHAVRRLHDRQ